jgi:hypothetical protein
MIWGPSLFLHAFEKIDPRLLIAVAEIRRQAPEFILSPRRRLASQLARKAKTEFVLCITLCVEVTSYLGAWNLLLPPVRMRL